MTNRPAWPFLASPHLPVDWASLAERVQQLSAKFREADEHSPLQQTEAALKNATTAVRRSSTNVDLDNWAPRPEVPIAIRERYQVHELLAFHDRRFIEAVYRTILRRAPDRGSETFLTGLRDGSLEKLDVIAALIRSPEGRSIGAEARVNGWRWRWLLRQVLRRSPGGAALRWAWGLAHLGTIHRRQQLLEVQHHALATEVERCLLGIQRELQTTQPARLATVLQVTHELLQVLRTRPEFQPPPPPPPRKHRPRVAFVIPRCGPSVVGGAEALGLALARTLSGPCEVEILSTCAVDYNTWEDHYPAGSTDWDGITVNRFSVPRPRDTAAFNTFYTEANRVPETVDRPLLDKLMLAQGPIAPGLLDHLRHQGQEYDAVFFVPYVYATTWFGLPLVADRAILIPCAHDEPPLRYPGWNTFAAQPAAWIYMTEEEQELVARRFPQAVTQGPIVAQPIQEPDDVSADRFRQTYNVTRPFLLYLGRIEESKGCHDLFTLHQHLRTVWPDAPDLILAGKQVMEIPAGVRYLGFLPDRDRWDAIAAAAAVVNPSPYESLSLILLEAWVLARPTLVNGHCAVLDGQTRRSGCGRTYHSPDEFVAGVRAIVAQPQMAIGGPAFVRTRYGRREVREALMTTINRLSAQRIQNRAP